MSNEKPTATNKTEDKAPAKKPRFILSDQDKEWIVGGLNKTKEEAAAVPPNQFFNPEKVVKRLEALIAHFSS